MISKNSAIGVTSTQSQYIIYSTILKDHDCKLASFGEKLQSEKLQVRRRGQIPA